MGGLLSYVCIVAALGFAVPSHWWSPHASAFFLTLGIIACWRYSWGAIHFIRSLIYRKIVFPRWRRQADALGKDGMPSEVFLLLTSFRIDTDTTAAVYRAAIREAIDCGVPTTLVCSIVEMCDQRLIKHLFHAQQPPAHVKLSFIRVGGTGKRDALAQGFRSISLLRPAADAVVVVVDGDTVLEPQLVRRTLPFFKLKPNMDALTSDEVCVVEGVDLFRDWYSLRFAQRQIQMSSMSLSNKVLTLTGRMSAFRASVVVQPDFIKMMERDSVEHWRLGRFQFLTGDDKTSWFYVLKSGKDMLYIPDVRVLTMEMPPHPGFVQSAGTLMTRWFGNMLRTNGRALALGPKRAGLFVWWSILDQRVTMWTTLIGPVGAILLTIAKGPSALFLYIYWVLLTRLVQTLALLTVRRDVTWRYPFLLYFNQVFGSIIKIYVVFRLDRQKWTRQKTTNERSLNSRQEQLVRTSSLWMHTVATASFIVAVAYLVGLFEITWADFLLLLA